MSEASLRLENLIGALAVAITDRVNEAAEEIVGMGGEAPAAIVQIGTMPGLTITVLGSALGLTHSATVRVVAKLERSKLVKKVRGDDAREVCVSLSPSGEKLMGRILVARETVIAKLLKPLDKAQRVTLDELFTLVLARAPRDGADAERIARMCDPKAWSDKGSPLASAE
jgi:MarR family transcriptional regulator, negative regulator of the multidrug operon emrRAB